MRELPAAAAAALQKNLQVAEFLPLLHCVRAAQGWCLFLSMTSTLTRILVFNARRSANSHACTERAYIIRAPNGLCVILWRILSFCDQVKLFCCRCSLHDFSCRRESWCFWQGREENCSAAETLKKHHLEALFDGSLIAHQIFGEKLMNGPLGMTQLYACSSSECFYSESFTFMDLSPREKKMECHQHSSPEKY